MNERTNTLLYKDMYLSHFILEGSVVYERCLETGTDCYIDPTYFILDVSVVCERCVETGTDCYIDPTSSLDHSITSSASWLRLLNRGTLRVTALCMQAGPHSDLSVTK